MSKLLQEYLVRVTDFLLIALLALILMDVFIAVIFRYVLNHSLSWSDELIRYLFTWFTLIGAAVVLRDRQHIRVDYFVEKLPNRVRRIVEALDLAIIVFFNAVLVVLGFVWVAETRGTFTPALRMPLNWVFYGSLPIGALLAMFFGIQRIWSGAFSELSSDSEE